jgi:hypothetical protein
MIFVQAQFSTRPATKMRRLKRSVDCIRFAVPQPTERQRLGNDRRRVYLRVYFGGGGGGRSELNISTAQSQLPSRCLRTTVTNFPESLTGPGAPGGVIVIV